MFRWIAGQHDLDSAPGDSEQQFRKLVEAASDIIYTVDLDRRFTYVSPKWKERLGSDPAEVVGRRYDEFIHPDDLAACKAFLERTLEGEQEGRIEYRVRHADGHWCWHSSNVAPLHDGGRRLIGIIGIAHDVSERKQIEDKLRISEERHRLLADNARDVIWTMEIDGSISYVSPAVEKVRGYTPEEAVRQPMDQILTPDSLASSLGYFAKLHAALEAGQPLESYRGDQEYYCKDGSTFWSEVIAFPLLDAEGKLIQIVGVTRDISERKRYEMELKKAHDATAAANCALQEANAELARHRDQLERQVLSRTLELAAARDEAESANLVKSRFMANVSHEMRTPLQGILGYSQLGESRAATLSPEESRRYFAGIRASGERMHKLVESLLSLAEQAMTEHAGLADEQSQAIGLSGFVAEIVALQGLHAERRRQRLIVEGHATAASLVGDPIRLRQVFEHLVGNALRYSPEEATITLRLADAFLPSKTTGRPVPAVSLQIIDQGCGVPESEINAIFEPFYESSRTATGAGGTGLGLTLSRSIVQRHGGTITLSNRPEGGVLCEVILPVDP